MKATNKLMKKMSYRFSALTVVWLMVAVAGAKTLVFDGKLIDEKGQPLHL